MYLILLFTVVNIVISTLQEDCVTISKDRAAHRETCSDINTTDFYCDKVILAPMVRMNSLPFRLLALDYGADIVYGPEVVDHRVLRSKRLYNKFLDTVDYVDVKDGSLVFRTCPRREKDKLIFQLGCSDPERAGEAAKFLSNDVVGIDINMGCPVHFSVVGGMGAVLLSDPAKARKIVEFVRKAVDIPVTCKIRIHENVEETISFCKQMVDGGVTAIAVHGRTQKQRPRHPNRLDAIKEVASNLSVPVIANGESLNISTYDDILSFRERSGCTSVMIARAAQHNPSIFRKEGTLPIDDVIRAYLKYAVHYDNFYSNTKFCIQSMLQNLMATPQGKALSEARSLEEIWFPDEVNVTTLGQKVIFPLIGKNRVTNGITGSELQLHYLLLDPYTIVRLSAFLLLDEMKEEARVRMSDKTIFFSSKIWNMDADWRRRMNEYNNSSSQVRSDELLSENDRKKLEIDTMIKDCQSFKYKFVRANFEECDLPKNVLQKYSAKRHVAMPTYNSWEVDDSFRAVVTFDGKKYTSTHWDRSRKSAEHAAAVVCLYYLNVYNEDELRTKGGVIW